VLSQKQKGYLLKKGADNVKNERQLKSPTTTKGFKRDNWSGRVGTRETLTWTEKRGGGGERTRPSGAKPRLIGDQEEKTS